MEPVKLVTIANITYSETRNSNNMEVIFSEQFQSNTCTPPTIYNTSPSLPFFEKILEAKSKNHPKKYMFFKI